MVTEAITLLRTTKIDYILTTDYIDDSDTSQTDTEKCLATPTTPKTPTIPLDKTARKKLEKDNKLARSYLLNNMSNPLFDLQICEHHMNQTGDEIWFR